MHRHEWQVSAVVCAACENLAATRKSMHDDPSASTDGLIVSVHREVPVG